MQILKKAKLEFSFVDGLVLVLFVVWLVFKTGTLKNAEHTSNLLFPIRLHFWKNKVEKK